jgi:transposase InsO family protein
LKFGLSPSSIPSQNEKKRTGAKIIITTLEYITKWLESEAVENCTKESVTKFIYENIVTRFGYPLTIIDNQGTHFINGTIEVLLKNFMIGHRKTISYHPQAKGAIESFRKTLHKGLTKICGLDREGWDEKFPVVLWDYRTTYKILIVQMPFNLVNYGQ